MKYVLQDKSVPQDKHRGSYYGYYVFSTHLVTVCLCNAKQFKSIVAARNFIHESQWASEYEIVKVSDKELFKAKLART